MIATNTFTLPNGLRVIHNYDDSTAMVAVDTLYNVGARDEQQHLTGLAHLFEHLMFGGSINVSDFDKAIERAGGWSNAWTNNDFTNFYNVVPAVNAETALWLESDRMLQLAFDTHSLEVQRQVVIEEFKQVCLNKPYGDMDHRLRKMLYLTHPYRYPTIGADVSHIERVTLPDIEQFYYSHYAPNNAVMAVSGALSFDQTRELVTKWFGDLPTRAIAPRSYPAEAPITEARRAEVCGNVPQAVIVIALPMCGYYDPQYVVCDIISDLLANGRSARFYQHLVAGSDVFAEADAAIAGSEEPGFLKIRAKLQAHDDDTIRRAEEMIWNELHLLARDGVTEYELTRAVNRFESTHTFGALNFLAKAQQLATSCFHNEDINAVVSRYRAVTPEQVKATAQEILRQEHSITLIYRPS